MTSVALSRLSPLSKVLVIIAVVESNLEFDMDLTGRSIQADIAA